MLMKVKHQRDWRVFVGKELPYNSIKSPQEKTKYAYKNSLNPLGPWKKPFFLQTTFSTVHQSDLIQKKQVKERLINVKKKERESDGPKKFLDIIKRIRVKMSWSMVYFVNVTKGSYIH